MLNVGFIGAGGRGQGAHYPSVHRLEGVNVQAVCELDEGKLKQVAEKYNIPRTFTDHRPSTASCTKTGCCNQPWIA